MAWEIELVQIVRGLIGDTDSTSYDYTNERLKDLILIAAQLVLGDATFGNSYTVDVDEITLTPDPTVTTKDNGFINLSCLKTACIILSSEWRTASKNAISFKDGPSSIDAKGVAAEKQALAKEACENYTDALMQYRAGNAAAGEAIVGPHRYSDAQSEFRTHYRNGGDDGGYFS